jgi:hypothetical protein
MFAKKWAIVWTLWFWVAAPPTNALAQTERPGVPSGCALDCKSQYQFLDGTSQSLVKAFGQPASSTRTKNKKYQFLLYEGVAVDYFELKDKSGTVVSGISVKGNPAHARVPLINLMTEDDQGKNRALFTANDLSFSVLLDYCSDIETSLLEANARRGAYWTPTCSFGRGGMYQDFHFLFRIRSTGCSFGDTPTKKEVEACRSLDKLLPEMAVVGPVDKNLLLEIAELRYPDY